MPIRILDPHVVSRIAAGEVIERPASVVKELVENALDAGSHQITVEVQGRGTNLIRVIDDGIGIPSAEVELAFKRHSTSKIIDFADLESISSLGFRGEALPSIAAVAQIDITTYATGEQSGTYLRLEGGNIARKESRGRNQGSTITVQNLFLKVPARLKFLKSTDTENSHIADVVSAYAFAFPEVRFALFINGRASLRTPGKGRLIDSIVEVYGLEVAHNMLEITMEDGEDRMTESLKVSGMISSPAINRSSRSYLTFFVNRRWITSRLLARAIEDAYHGLLMEGRHPISVINISLPASEIDVNIHPTKAEIQFRNERLIFTSIQKVVRRTLVKLVPVPKLEASDTAYISTPAEGTLFNRTSSTSPLSPPPIVSQTPLMCLPVLRVLGQILSCYIVAEGPNGLFLIDQHAAHERVIFEKIKAQRSQKELEVQGLIEPVPFEVSAKQLEILKSQCEELAQLGFSIEPFGEKMYLVRAVPVLLYNKDWSGMLREVLDSLSATDRTDLVEKVAISMACHGAVRAGQILTDEEIRELIRQLEKTTLPNTCPHGRPTMIHLSSREIEKEFGRR